MLIRNIFIRSKNSFLYPDSNIHACLTVLKIRTCSTSLVEDKRKQYWTNGNTLKNNNLQTLGVQSFTSAQNILRFKSTDSSTSTIPKENTVEESSKKKIIVPLTMSEKLKKAMKEYGSTVIVFHMGISLISLGTCYLLVTSGLDVTKVLTAVGLNEWVTKSQIASSAGTFAVAYAIHKVFAPVRITITLASVPLIVRYLRRIGFLKK